MPDLQLNLLVWETNNGGTTRFLNQGANGAAHMRFSSSINGGYEIADCRIPSTEWDAHDTSVYVYGAEVRIRRDTAGGDIVWEGWLNLADPNPDGTVKLEAKGFRVWLEEREEPMLWQDRYYGDWACGDDEPFEHNDSDAIINTVGKGQLRFTVPKNQSLEGSADPSIAGTDRARILWWAPHTPVKRVAFRLKTNRNVSNYDMRIEKWDKPNGTNATVIGLGTELATAGVNSIDQELTNPEPCIGFLFWRTSDTTDTPEPFRVWIDNLRVNGTAYRQDPADWDQYGGHGIVNDLHDKLGWTDDGFSDGTGLLPLWWDDGTWAELMDHVAVVHGGGSGTGAWWRVVQGPQIQLAGWDSGDPTNWHVNAFGSSANSNIDIRPSDDRYTHIDVKYHYVHSRRWHHYRLATGITFAAGRERVLRYKLGERLKTRADDGSINAEQTPALVLLIATQLQTDYGLAESWQGTVNCADALNETDSNEYSSHYINAGDKITVDDYPGGAKTFKIIEVDHSDDAPSIIGIGRKPQTLERLLLRRERRQARSGIIPS